MRKRRYEKKWRTYWDGSYKPFYALTFLDEYIEKPMTEEELCARSPLSADEIHLKTIYPLQQSQTSTRARPCVQLLKQVGESCTPSTHRKNTSPYIAKWDQEKGKTLGLGFFTVLLFGPMESSSPP